MKLFKSAVVTLTALTIATVALTGCGTAVTKDTAKPTVINMTYVKSPLNIPSIIEKDSSLFETEFGKENIKIDYSNLDAGPKQTEALAAGSIDICHALGGTSAILAAANGVDLKIVGIYSRAPEAFAIIIKDPTIQTVEDLKGKTIAGPKGTILHQLLIAALAKEGLQPDDVNFISMGIPQAAAALINGSADAALLAGPIALKIQQQDGARVLTTGKGLLDATIVIAANNTFIQKYPDVMKQFMAIHSKVVTDYLNNPKSAYGATMKETGLTEAQIATMEKWYDFDPVIKDSDIKDLEKTQDFLIQTNMLKPDKKIDIKSIITTLK